MSAGPPVANFASPLLLMTSINCLLYFSGCGCLRMVLARMTLLTIPRSVSPDAVSLPSQIAGMNRGSSFGRSLCVGSWYCTVSPNSQSGDWCFLFHLRKKLHGVAVCVYCVPVEQVHTVSYQPWHDWMLAGKSDVVVLKLCFECSNLSHQCAMETFDTSL